MIYSFMEKMNIDLIAAVIVAFILLPSHVALAASVSEEEVRKATQTWVRHITAEPRPEAEVERLDPHETDGEVVAYIAHLRGGGYCICGADDRLWPVYLYRPIGEFDPANPNYQYILDDIAGRLKHMDDKNARFDRRQLQSLAQRARTWEDLVAQRVPAATKPSGPGRAAPTMMSLPVSSYWHQGSPYNDQCPTLSLYGDDHVVVGCGATTAAQIMYYWRWPETGTGQHLVQYERRNRYDWDYEALTTDPQLSLSSFFDDRLYWTSFWEGRLYMSGAWDPDVYNAARGACSGGVDCDDPDYHAALEALWHRMPIAWEVCYADFSATTYDFGIMRDNHIDPPDAGAAEAAELCSHAGIAQDMSYGIWGSGSTTIRDGMVEWLHYDPDAIDEPLDIDAIITDIQWLRPVNIMGNSARGGHSWIACGYDKSKDPYEFLMNLGWGGGSTEWVVIDDYFPVEQWTTTRLAPESAVRFVGGSSGGDGSPGDPYPDLETALASAPDGTTLIFKAGSTHTSSGTINKPVTLKGHHITIRPASL